MRDFIDDVLFADVGYIVRENELQAAVNKNAA
jgi:hypothetical protein